MFVSWHQSFFSWKFCDRRTESEEQIKNIWHHCEPKSIKPEIAHHDSISFPRISEQAMLYMSVVLNKGIRCIISRSSDVSWQPLWGLSGCEASCADDWTLPIGCWEWLALPCHCFIPDTENELSFTKHFHWVAITTSRAIDVALCQVNVTWRKIWSYPLICVRLCVDLIFVCFIIL